MSVREMKRERDEVLQAGRAACWYDLPPELHDAIAASLDEPSRVALQFVSRAMRDLVSQLPRGAVSRLCQTSARCGHRALVEWGVALGSDPACALNEAARGGHLALVQWMCAYTTARWSSGWHATARTFAKAARSGNLALVEWLYARRCKRDARAVTAAAASGSLPVLQFLHGKKGMPITLGAFDAAAKHDQIAALEWLASAAPTLVDIVRQAECAAHHGSMRVMEPLLHRIPDASRYYGLAGQCRQLALMVMLHKNGVPIHPTTLWAVAHNNNNEAVIDWLIENECPRDSGDAVCLVRHGYVAQAQRIIDNGVQAEAELLEIAATRGDVALIDWLELRRCPRTSAVALYALVQGHSELARTLVERGYPMSVALCTRAIKTGDLALVQWLRARGCPWAAECVRAAWKTRDDALYRWVVAQGCPLWDVWDATSSEASLSISSQSFSSDDDDDDESDSFMSSGSV